MWLRLKSSKFWQTNSTTKNQNCVVKNEKLNCLGVSYLVFVKWGIVNPQLWASWTDPQLGLGLLGLFQQGLWKVLRPPQWLQLSSWPRPLGLSAWLSELRSSRQTSSGTSCCEQLCSVQWKTSCKVKRGTQLTSVYLFHKQITFDTFA